MRMYLRIVIILTMVVTGLSSPAQAGWPCSIDHAYPEVSELSIRDGKLVAILGSYFSVREESTRANARVAYTIKYPHLSMSKDGEWTLDEMGQAPEEYARGQQHCLDAPKDVQNAWSSQNGSEPLTEYASRRFNQSIKSCATDGKNIWGGISFYGGEGYWGAGGLAKKNIETGDVEYIRPLPRTFTSDSTGPIAYFANTVWMGTYWNGECGGPPSGGGMKRLDRYQDTDHYTAEDVPEVCGFAVRDFQEFNDALWVATELGLSKLAHSSDPEWVNFVPDLNDPGLMRELSCDELYKELLSSSRLAETAGFDIGNAFNVFWQRLSQLRPEFITRYVRELHNLPTEGYPNGSE